MEFQLPKTCGVNVNLNNLRGELQAQASAILNVNLGTPAGLQEIANSIEGKLNTLKDKVAAQLPEIPQEIKSLKADLTKLAGMAVGSVEALQQQAAIALDYAGIKDLKGFADINLDDLASSVFSISGTFDPCAMTIPDVSLDPSGALTKVSKSITKLGEQAESVVTRKTHVITNSVNEAIKNNVPVIPTDSIITSLKNIQSNVSTVPVDPPPAEPTFTPSVGKYAWGPNGEVPKEMQDWSATDVSDYITSITKLYRAGKVGPGAVSKAVALKKFHAAKYVAFQNQKVTDWRKESPDFDDPSSPNYRMLFGRTKVKLGIDSQTGLEAWQRA